MIPAVMPESPCTGQREAVWVLTGPSASGKTKVALEIAEREGLQIASMDSMAVYRRMDIGTAKPSRAERQRVPHHLIDLCEPNQPFDTARYCVLADQLLRAHGRRLLFVGGTPLYLMAFFKGIMDGPAADAPLRAELAAREAAEPGSLHRELDECDPEAAARIHRNDTRRLVRALEVVRLTGTPITARHGSFDRPQWRVPCRIVAIGRPREELRERVKQRTVAMLESGLLDEVQQIHASCGFSRQSAAAIGYAQCLHHIEHGYKDLEELRNMIRRATHKLIRRQTTWLRRIPDLAWIPAENAVEAALERLRC